MDKETAKAMKVRTAKALNAIGPEFDAIANKLDSMWYRLNHEYGFKTNKDKDAVMDAIRAAESAVIDARNNLSTTSGNCDKGES